jgi:ABC-type bacteriocin/lantibiotic exporter with double-glycine peptidase domain
MVGTGAATLGMFVLAVTLRTRLCGEARRAVESIKHVTRTVIAAEHYMWLKGQRPARERGGWLRTRERSGRPDRVAWRWLHLPGAAEPVLRGADLTLESGQTVAIVGLEGAGKTTLVKPLTGMCAPTGGDMLLDGRPPGVFDAVSWQGRTTSAFQDSFQLAKRDPHDH